MTGGSSQADPHATTRQKQPRKQQPSTLPASESADACGVSEHSESAELSSPGSGLPIEDSDLSEDEEPSQSSGIPSDLPTQGHTSQESDRDIENSEVVQVTTQSPETIVTSDVNLVPAFDLANRTITSTTTTTTTTTKKAAQRGRDLSSSQSITSQRRHQIGELQRKPSVHFESTPRSVSSASRSWHFSVPAKSSAAIENSLFEIQHLHRQETDHIILIMKARLEEHQAREHAYQEQFVAFQTEREELLRELSSSASEISVLRIKISFCEANHSGSAPSYDDLDSIVTTTITTVVATITSVTTKIKRWKDTVFGNNGDLTISKTDLDELSLSLSNASIQMTKLQQDYDEMSKELVSVRSRLEMTSSLCDEKDRTITLISDEDAAKGQQIIALRSDNDSLRRDVSTMSAENEELQQHHETLSAQLAAAQKGLASIKDKEDTISFLRDRVAQLERSDAAKMKQINTLRQENEKLRRDTSGEMEGLRGNCATLTKERDSARNELRESKFLVDERDHTITSLSSEVAKWKGSNDTTTHQLDVERQEKEKLQNGLAAQAAKISNLQERCDVHSKEIISLRDELQIKMTLLSEQEHSITSIATDRDQARREIALKEELVATTRQKTEQLQQELSTFRKDKADLQGQFDTQLTELNKLREELNRLKLIDGRTSDEHLDLADYIRGALEEKEKKIEGLLLDRTAAASREKEIQKSYEKLSEELSALSDNFKVKTSLYETAKGTIDSLTVQVGQLKAAVTEKTEQVGTANNRVRELELEVNTFTVQLKELQGRHETQSQEFISVKNQLSTLSLSMQEKDRIIPDLTAERNKLAEQISKLQRGASDVDSQLTELRDRHKKQSDELVSVQSELKICKESIRDKERDVAASGNKVAELERTNTLNEKRILDGGKRMEGLQQELTNSRTRIAILEQDNKTQSTELDSLRDQIRAMEVDGNATISSLNAQVEEWKKKYTVAGDELKEARKTAEQLRHDIDLSTSRYSELERKLTSQITRLELSVTAGSTELTATNEKLTDARAELEKLHQDLSISSSKIAEYHEKYEKQTKELILQVEQWKNSSTAGEKELTTARKSLEELQGKLDDSSSQITQLSQNYKTQSAKLEYLQEKFSDMQEGSDSEEWEVTKTKILSEVKDYTSVINLTAIVDEWVSADAKRAQVLALQLEERNKENEELRQKLVTLREIYIRAPRIKQIFQSETIEIKRRYEEESKALKAALLDSQQQLRGVQRVVATADTYADETIISALKRLNAEVQQNTTYMAERIAEAFQPGNVALTKEQSQSVSKAIGKTFANGLASTKEEDVELYLSIAFQAFLSYYLRRAISSWTIEKGHNEFIEEIYEKLHKAEPQPLSGRWRALTRAYISPTWMNNSSSIAQEIVVELSFVVVAAGCATSVAAANSKLLSFKDKILSIITTAGQFSDMIGKTVSADFAVVAPPPLQIFENTTMEEDDVDDDSPEKGKVLCATQLGMTKRMQRESGSETLTVMKAKVVFESFLQG